MTVLRFVGAAVLAILFIWPGLVVGGRNALHGICFGRDETPAQPEG